MDSVIITGPRDSAADEDSVRTVFLSVLHPQNESDPTVWRTTAGDVTDHPLVQDLIPDLMALEVVKCVDYHPSAGALTLCGFDSPAATLTVHYTTASGANDSLTVRFGNRSADDTGRYVQIGDDTTMFLMETALLDPLMPISSKGLN